MQPFVICTDSAADLPWLTAIAQKVEIAHLHYSMNDTVSSYTPGRETDLSAFYFALRNNTQAETISVLPEAYKAMFEPHLIANRDILLLSLSRYVSKSFVAAQHAREELLSRYPSRRIVLLDTLCAGVAQGLLVNEAALMRQEGEELDHVANWVLENRAYINGLLLPASLTRLREAGFFRGGAMGELLGRRLLLSMDGAGCFRQAASCKDDEDALHAFVHHVQQMGYALNRQVVAITHTDQPDLAARLREALIGEIGCDDAAILPMGPIAGSYVGPDAVGVAFYGRARN